VKVPVWAIGVGAPPLVWIELAPLTFLLDLVVVVNVLLAGYCSWTSGMSPKVGCSELSVMVERICVGGWFWVEVWGRPSSGWIH
jgi:hypothetical protein